ncbi:hypothetical protein BC940DRAFT_110917 [Gongronella butleri]|nr:hypothetical protein BC940DRAFT_110917 [Gongronella butleri]
MRLGASLFSVFFFFFFFFLTVLLPHRSLTRCNVDQIYPAARPFFLWSAVHRQCSLFCFKSFGSDCYRLCKLIRVVNTCLVKPAGLCPSHSVAFSPIASLIHCPTSPCCFPLPAPFFCT